MPYVIVIQVHAPEGGSGSVWPLVLQHLAGQEDNSWDGSPPETSDLFPSAPSDESNDGYSDACYD
jgi:hypothetical protein